MRISTSLQYYSGTQNILQAQGQLNKLQNELSTGRKITTPSDDPVGAARALLVSQSKSVNSQYLTSQNIAQEQLSMTDSVLGNISNTLTSAIASAVQGGDATYSDAERKAIATELRQQLSGMVDLANSKTATGEYIFGGYRSNTAPFNVVDTWSTTNPTGTYVQYKGNGGSQQLQVESSTKVAITENGSEVFMRVLDKSGNPTNESVFDSMNKMINYLETPDAPNVSKAQYDAALANLNSDLDQIARARASVGARQSMVTSLNTSSQDMATQYDTALSSLQDLDYASAISDFTLQQTQLQAAQQSFMKVSGSSLFNYL